MSFLFLIRGAHVAVKPYLAMIGNSEIVATYPIDVYTMYCALISSGYSQQIQERDPVEQIFFLIYPDNKGDHVIVNKAYNIVSIID